MSINNTKDNTVKKLKHLIMEQSRFYGYLNSVNTFVEKHFMPIHSDYYYHLYFDRKAYQLLDFKSFSINMEKDTDFSKYYGKSTIPVNRELFSAKIEEYLKEKGITQADIVDRTGIDKKDISTAINKTGPVSQTTLYQICFALELDLEESKELIYLCGKNLNARCLSDIVFTFSILQGEYDFESFEYAYALQVFFRGYDTLWKLGKESDLKCQKLGKEKLGEIKKSFDFGDYDTEAKRLTFFHEKAEEFSISGRKQIILTEDDFESIKRFIETSSNVVGDDVRAVIQRIEEQNG
ncbi:transcriptional regulator with XRE-family HTH domain [Clostridiales Family XIII bacterium PM5-7]